MSATLGDDVGLLVGRALGLADVAALGDALPAGAEADEGALQEMASNAASTSDARPTVLVDRAASASCLSIL